MSQRVEILRTLVREELMRRDRRGTRLSSLIRFVDLFEMLNQDERDHLRDIANKNPQITAEDVDISLAERGNDDDDEDEDEDEAFSV